MACYHPVPFYQDKKHEGPRTIGGPVRINPPVNTETGYLPCGNCLGCKARRATDWATRCSNEASLYRDNRFLTLTYDDEHLPPNGWLRLRDAQLFMKRLRKAFPNKIRFFLTGEYGSQTGRPHYHALLFNCAFPDEVKHGKLYTSRRAEEIWGQGQVRIGLVTKASALYVAKYSIKSGKGHPSEDGEAPPAPFATMSRRPGIGAPWLEKFESDLQHGYTVQQHQKAPIPRAYLKRMQERTREHIDHIRHQTPPRAAEPRARLEAAEQIHAAKLALYNRDTL